MEPPLYKRYLYKVYTWYSNKKEVYNTTLLLYTVLLWNTSKTCTKWYMGDLSMFYICTLQWKWLFWRAIIKLPILVYYLSFHRNRSARKWIPKPHNMEVVVSISISMNKQLHASTWVLFIRMLILENSWISIVD